MKKTAGNLILLNVVFIVALITANVVTGKVISTGLTLFGAPLTIPGAVLCYAMTFLVTDVIGEIWGKKEANRAVRNGFIGQLMASALILITQYLPAADPAVQTAYETILGQNLMFSIGSLAAYCVSQSWDVWVFHRIRGACMKKQGGSVRNRWIWNNASTMTSQIFDTVIFIGIAFGLGFGWLFDPEMLPTLFAMMVGQYLVKMILAALDTPFFYFLTRGRSQSAEAYLPLEGLEE